MRLKLTAFMALAVCGGLLLASAASAGAPHPTQVTIKEQSGDFSGKVKSENSSCIADRTVTVLKKRKNRPDKKINSDTTDKAGKWNTGNTGVGKGKYYARAKRVAPLKTAMRGTVLCRAGKSKVVTVG
jgi:hypothetical protein